MQSVELYLIWQKRVS